MNRKGHIAAATVAFVAIFLVFLGMRNPWLDSSPDPKPRPRAVLNPGKTLNAAPTVKPDQFPTSFALLFEAPTHLPPQLYLIGTAVASVHIPVVAPVLRANHDRAPPRC